MAVEKELSRLGGSNNNNENMEQTGSHVALIDQKKQKALKAAERGYVCTMYTYQAMISRRRTDYGRHPPATLNVS